MPRFSRFIPLAAATLALAPAARANGRFPAANQFVVDPSDPSHLVARTTYGTLYSKDGGKSFAWVCEQAVGYNGQEDPMMGILADGTILAGVFAGLSVSHDGGCGWSFEGGPLDHQVVADLVVQKDDPARALVVTSSGVGDGGFDSRLVETTDSGKTWTAIGAPLGADFLALTVEVAPSDPDRVYVSGFLGTSSGRPGVVARSDDRGKTWQRFTVDLMGAANGPWIGAVDPADPDRVYLRLDGDPVDRVLVSDDGAATWRAVFASNDQLAGFALSPDGEKLAIGGRKDGVQVASTQDLAFAPASDVGAVCLTWAAAGLYACGVEGVAGFTLGLSTDEGKTFQAIHHLGDPCPLACGATSSMNAQCTGDVWSQTQSSLAADPAHCPADGGSGGAGGAGGSGGAPAGGGPPGGDAPASARDEGGCAIGRGPGAIGAGAALAIAALGLAARRRRRR